MKNSLTVLGAAVIIGLAIFFGMERIGDLFANTQQTTTVVPDIHLRDREVFNRIDLHLDDIKQIVHSIDNAFKDTPRGGYVHIASHAKEIYGLTSQIRTEGTKLQFSDADKIRILIRPVRTATHELEEAANDRNHDDSHHAFDNLNHQLEQFEVELRRMR